MATVGSLDDHEKSASATAFPFASNASAARRSVSPGPIVASAGVTVTDDADCITDTEALPDAEPDDAVMAAAPSPLAVTSPAESTVATSVSLLDHETVTPSIVRPAWSLTSAASRPCWPMAVNASVSGVTATVVGSGSTTVSLALPATPADVAMISTSPAEIPVTRPSPSTMATSVSPDAHANTVPATGFPLASAASAMSRTVSAVRSVSVAGDTVTVLTSWATVTAAVPEAEPAVAVTIVAPLPTAVTSPAGATVATDASLLVHATAAPAITCPF